MNILILGLQGSGKGTQANLLSKKLQLPHIDAGEMLRDEVRRGTSIGKHIQRLMDAGQLIPNMIAPKLIEKRLAQSDCKCGFILDGFPRNKVQAKALESFAKIDRVIVLKVSGALAVKRLSNRWQCEQCNTIYGITILPKKKGVCDVCGGKLVQRADDTPGAIKKRLKIYHKETEPLLKYYAAQGLVNTFDASKSVQNVVTAILKSFKK